MINEKKERVDLHILSGVLASFLMLGIAFASIYRVEGMAFSGANPAQFAPWIEMIYFSFATITTVGWGDISAVNEYTRVVAILESVFGLVFNAVVISRFANIFWVHRQK